MWLMLQPIILSAKNRLFPVGHKPWKAMGVSCFSLLVCLALYLVSMKVLRFFHGQNELGVILSLKIFEMAWILMFAMQIFSCMVSSVSTLFVSDDNEIVFSAPVPLFALFGMRYWTLVFYTSWMMILFALPVFVAFGVVFEAGIFYWPFLIISVIAIALTGVGAALIMTILLVRFFPARRTKDIIFYLSCCFALFIYLMFRMLRPELLANPDEFATFVDYLSAISAPTGPYVPGAWAANFLSLYLVEQRIDWEIVGLLILTPISLYIVGEWCMVRYFFEGVTKAQESFGGHRVFSRKKGMGAKRQGIFRLLAAKELKQFLRDSSEWSQLFMIAALVVVYLYNFKVLPLDRTFWQKEYLANLIAFLNIGLTGFVSASLAARFVFPSIGAEGGSFYLVRTAPISLWRFLLSKLYFYCLPFISLSVVLVVVSDYLLAIEGPAFWVSLGTSIVITVTEVGLALGFGALFADFKAENRAAVMGGIGAIAFLLASLLYISLVLGTGAIPAYHMTKRWIRVQTISWVDAGLFIGWLMLAVSVSIVIVFLLMKKGIAHLEEAG